MEFNLNKTIHIPNVKKKVIKAYDWRVQYSPISDLINKKIKYLMDVEEYDFFDAVDKAREIYLQGRSVIEWKKASEEKQNEFLR